jgi:sporulation protein YabP
MDKEIITGNHTVNIVKRSSINISGVKKIDNFNDNEFVLETIMGFMNIKGSGLEIIKLDTYQGDVAIKGKIDSIIYSDVSNKKNKEESIFSKLFK